MDLNFDDKLATVLGELARSVMGSDENRDAFKANPTEVATKFLKQKGLAVPELFHAHAVENGSSLPAEPELATKDRYVYIYRKSGLFEFKQVPGSPEGDDSIMTNPQRACCCCNCCVIVF
jgi:hypothetical protein